MITSRRAVLAAHEGWLAEGITKWMAGEDEADAVAASRIVAETVIMWRRVLQTKFSSLE